MSCNISGHGVAELRSWKLSPFGVVAPPCMAELIQLPVARHRRHHPRAANPVMTAMLNPSLAFESECTAQDLV
ncbi:hypothetical protein PanWU01x14_083410 [Parasponia andersonii]|uniref:Uncharacterized protein n=1 Tax=Parasponia andersonii TaxID=3476 RepID=A0A2P5DA67_PARAD|nr:hypothetical protein PanWU01x14_083410 [Parasponia andersonii]